MLVYLNTLSSKYKGPFTRLNVSICTNILLLDLTSFIDVPRYNDNNNFYKLTSRVYFLLFIICKVINLLLVTIEKRSNVYAVCSAKLAGAGGKLNLLYVYNFTNFS